MVRPCVARGFCRSVGIAVLHQCIRPLIGAVCAPGHHGYQRACVLLSGQVSMDHSGHQCSHAPGRPILHLVLSSRRPRRETGLCHRLLLFSSFVRAMRPFLRPGLPLFGASRAGAVKTGRSLRPPVGLGRSRARCHAQADRDAIAGVFMHSNGRSLRRTAQAIRASLLASAIASTLWCNLFLAASIQVLRP